ncbi:Rha family transcriptional regulator [Floricoccus penangensis]|uniref:Rha family transcriptional regulator n=1 Tax=Floricoccus penangensis TaxID=1859475 RepID=UPI00203EFB37|nr:Rha family transcriptional regulator [Floricoccus penangensis]
MQRQSVKRLIDNHKKDLEQFGRLGFEIRPFEGSRGQKAKIYYLNRNQAMLLITYLDNTKPVRKFKQELIKRFDEMEKELSVRKLERAIEKQHGKTLTEAIEHWKYCNSHSFQNIRQLLTKTVTGLNARELRKQRSDGEKYILLDLLTAEELAEYKR